MTAPTQLTLERRRTGWDVLFGVLLVIAGFIVLAHVALAGVISVLFTGWMLLIGGVVLVVGAVVNWSDPPRRWGLASGALIGVLGLAFVRNPGIGLLTLTLIAGSLLFVGGILRLVLAFQPGMPRGLLLFSGIITLALSLLILIGWPASALWFLGTVLGIELIIDGITMALTGRVRLSQVTTAETAEV
jgi:uncharacterized membrane protein HdeD (DUF308 family)